MSSPRKALLLVVLAAGAAHADGAATTLFDSRPYVRDGGYQESPIYESFSLFARSDGNTFIQDVRVVARGWGRITLGDPFDTHRTAGDVDSLFVEGRLLKQHLTLRLGRQLAVGGAMRATQFDGLTARGVLAGGFGIEAWGGAPVQPRFGVSEGDALAGGRVFWNHGFDSEVGASYVYALRRGYLSRSDFALDGSWTPIRTVTISGIAQWEMEDRRFAEGRLNALWQATKALQISLDVNRTRPDLFLDRSSIFAVFAEEVRNEAGGEVVYRFTQPFSVSADWHWFRVEDGHGHRGTVRGTYRTKGGSFGAELVLLTQPDNGYKQARLFAIRRLPENLTATIDLDAYWLEQAIRATGESRSFVATASLAWAISAAWEAMLAGSLGTTPYFEHREEVIARLTWKFGLPGGWR